MRSFKERKKIIMRDVDIRQMLEECEISDPEDILDESDEKFIPARDASESKCNLEVNFLRPCQLQNFCCRRT